MVEVNKGRHSHITGDALGGTAMTCNLLEIKTVLHAMCNYNLSKNLSSVVFQVCGELFNNDFFIANFLVCR